MKLDFVTGYIEACRLVAYSDYITTFPYDIRPVIHSLTDIKCKSFSLARKYGVEPTDYGSESAIIVRKNSKIIIFYNEKEEPKRMDSSITHDFGHYVYKHPLKTKEELVIIDPFLYEKCEKEAFFFYAQVKMPDQILRFFEKSGINVDVCFIMKYFGVSKEAAVKRVAFLESNVYEWRKKEEKQYDSLILKKFDPFINYVLNDYNKKF